MPTEETFGCASSHVKADVFQHRANGTVGFYGVTAIVQRSGAAQAEFTITIGTSDTSWGFKTSDQFNAFVLQIREIRDTLAAMGLWAGS